MRTKPAIWGGLSKSVVFGGLSTILRMANALIISKAIALYGGPAILAATGNFINYAQFAQFLSTGALSVGIVSLLSSAVDSRNTKYKVLQLSLSLTLLVSLFVGVLTITFSTLLSSLLFNDETFYYLFVFLGFGIFFYGNSAFLQSYYTALGKYKSYAFLGIGNAVVGIALSCFLIYLFRLKGALVSIALYSAPGLVFFGSKQILRLWSKSLSLIGWLDRPILLRILSYSGYLIVNIVSITVSAVVLRNYLAIHTSTEIAGIWEAMFRISSSYNNVVAAIFMLYFLPKFSRSGFSEAFRTIIVKGGVLIAALSVCLLVVYFFRHPVIEVLFTYKFYELERLMPFYFIGDLFRLFGYLIALYYLSKGKVLFIIVLDVIFNMVGHFAWLVLLGKDSIFISVGQAFLLNYLLYFLTLTLMLVYQKSILKRAQQQ